MTIVTKAMGEKKASDKMEQPLFVDNNTVTMVKTKDVEAGKPDLKGHYFVSRKSIQRFHATATFLLFLGALMIMIIGVIGGLFIFRQYVRTRVQKFHTGWYNIPYDNNAQPIYQDGIHESLLADTDLFKKNFLKEHVEIDVENDNEKIDVPDFREGYRGRFIHDFNINKTAIIDIDKQRCFIMPLNRQRVLPPQNLLDLLQKMYNGYYEVDIEVVKETMFVVRQPVEDLSTLGLSIARECQGFQTFNLKKINSPVIKRSISSLASETITYSMFAGKLSQYQVHIMN